MIAIVDTGVANLASVENAVARLGRTAALTADAGVIRRAAHVVLPGVGAARDAMARIEQAGLEGVLRGLRQPVLGICLGMQILFARSAEGDVACLGVLPGVVTALAADPARGVTVPHMGWNNLTTLQASALLAGVSPTDYFYFVHSFRVPPGPWTRATTFHGGPVVAVIEHENFFGVQFHPERSGGAGAALLERFFSL